MIQVWHISIAEESATVVLGASDEQVEVWDYDSGVRISAFDTVLSSGGWRLAISARGDRVVAASWERGGLACYDAASGQRLWQTKLSQIQSIRRGRDGASVVCCREKRSCVGIRLEDGAQVDSWPGVMKRVDSRYGEFSVLEGRVTRVVGPDPSQSFRINHSVAPALTWCFGPETLLMSEWGGPVRCFELSTGAELWRYLPPGGGHFVRLGYSVERGQFLGVCKRYHTQYEDDLFSFSADGRGTWMNVTLERERDTRFNFDASILITASGSVYQTSTGRLLRKLPVGA